MCTLKWTVRQAPMDAVLINSDTCQLQLIIIDRIFSTQSCGTVHKTHKNTHAKLCCKALFQHYVKPMCIRSHISVCTQWCLCNWQYSFVINSSEENCIHSGWCAYVLRPWMQSCMHCLQSVIHMHTFPTEYHIPV